jgi:hypothetical protein
MASTYSTNLAIELIGTGDQAGSWGNTTNTNLGTLIEQAISGYVTQAVSTGTDTTITIPNGATGVARNMYIELTGTGGASTNLIVPANKKLYFIFNNASGAVTVKVSGQTGVSVPAGKKVVLASNGTDTVNALNYIADFGSNSATITQLTATSATITNLTLTSLVISNLSIASANITTLTSASATITNLLGTTLTISGNSFLATSSGNVGIGTSSPTFSAGGGLHISNATAANLRLQDTTTNVYTNIWQADNGSTSSFLVDIDPNNVGSGGCPLVINTAGSMKVTLSSSGNLGLGVSPSAWSASYKAFEFGSGSLMGRSTNTDIYLLSNSYLNTSGNFIYKSSAAAGYYSQAAGAHYWYNAASGTAGNAISFTQAMTLDAAGRLLIGQTVDKTQEVLRVSGSGQASLLVDNSGKTNGAFVGAFNDAALLGVNRNPSTGSFYNTSNRATDIVLVGSATDSYIIFETSTAANTTPTERARIDANGDLLVGTSSSSGRITVVTGAGSQAALFQSGSGTTQQAIATFSNVTNSGYLSIAGVGTSSSVGTWTNGSMVIEAVPNSTGNLFIGAYTGDLVFQNGRNNSGRFTSGGDLCVKKTTADATTEGAALQANGRGIFTSNSATECILANRQDSDGTLVDFRQANTTEGSISVSGNTVSYNAFAGSHWSQLQDGSKPDILRGTVMESINELCVWPGENNERLPKSKISDTAGSKKVYGVFMAWDNDWTATNDMYVTAVGAFICRVNGSVTVQEGDLLESNGDGTARVQADDIIRSSTIGKVTSTVKTHQYDDGSYCVPTVLYCG